MATFYRQILAVKDLLVGKPPKWSSVQTRLRYCSWFHPVKSTLGAVVVSYFPSAFSCDLGGEGLVGRDTATGLFGAAPLFDSWYVSSGTIGCSLAGLSLITRSFLSWVVVHSLDAVQIAETVVPNRSASV
ncbi:MAG: hypothetical protein WBD31_01970 [Rubripirellula sp.]